MKSGDNTEDDSHDNLNFAAIERQGAKLIYENEERKQTKTEKDPRELKEDKQNTGGVVPAGRCCD